MIEVTRILVYQFETNEDAQKHMEQTTIPMNGTKAFNRVKIHSASFVELFRKEDEE